MSLHLEDDGVSLLSGGDDNLLGELVYGLELGIHLLDTLKQRAGGQLELERGDGREGEGTKEVRASLGLIFFPPRARSGLETGIQAAVTAPADALVATERSRQGFGCEGGPSRLLR